MKRILILLVFLFFAHFSFSQGLWLAKNASPIESIDQILMPSQNNKSLVAKVRQSNKERVPKVFAKKIETEINFKENGTWESMPGDRLLWRVGIKSIGAYSLNFGFSNFYLPPSAAMFIYSKDRTYVIGPITNNDNDKHKEWWSPILPFEEVIIEVQLASNELNALTMEVKQVNHDFSGFGALLSGSCNVDVSCGAEDGLPLIDEYRDIINSVGMYTVRGIETCSGSLINTTKNDCTPYFLTAYHCEVGLSDAPTVVVYWNFENSVCRAPDSPASGLGGDGPRDRFNSGTRLIAGYDASDFLLLLLDDDVNTEYDPFYAGWDRVGENFDTTFCIHHPNSEEKRISFDYDTSIPYADEFYMRVEGWEFGTTEGGSSGAPLFNKDKRIIGQLTGGLAACGNSDFDDFGMMKLSWEGGGTSATRLKDWLDPDNTGVFFMDGRACKDIVTVSPDFIELCKLNQQRDTALLSISSGFENGADIEVLNAPNGVDISFSSINLTTRRPASVYIDVSDLEKDFIGNLQIQVSDGLTSSITNLRLSVNVDIPEDPQLLSPVNSTEGINFDVNFEWQNTGSTYTLEIAEDSLFLNGLITISDIQTNSTRVTGLMAAADYYWRLFAINQCGQSDYSEVFTFSTGNIICNSQKSNDGPFEIITESNVVRSSIFIDEDLEIADINVLTITGKHTWISDLEFRLIGPNGQKVDLLINGCDMEDDFLISFDDESENINLKCPITNSATYRPTSPLSVFDGLNSKGEWVLEITDDVFLDGGSFESWTLELCLLNDDSFRSVDIAPNSILLCENSSQYVDLMIDLAGNFDEDVSISLINGLTDEIIESAKTYKSVSPITIEFSKFSSFLDSSEGILTIEIVDSRGIERLTIPVSVQLDNIMSTLIFPMQADTGISRTPVLRWATGSGSVMTTISFFSEDDVMLFDSIVTDKDSIVMPFKLDKLTTYKWNVTSVGKCSPEEVTDIFSFRTTTSVSTQEIIDAGINVYPNPAYNRLTIAIDESWASQSRIIIYSLEGRIMKTAPLEQSKYDLDISDLSEGMYFYRINNGEQRYVHKLVVVH